MRYVEPTDLFGLIPAAALAALAPEGKGDAAAKALEALCEKVSREIDAALAPRYVVPLSYPYPPVIHESARALVLSTVHEAAAKAIARQFDDVIAGKAPLRSGEEIPALRPVTAPAAEPAAAS